MKHASLVALPLRFGLLGRIGQIGQIGLVGLVGLLGTFGAACDTAIPAAPAAPANAGNPEVFAAAQARLNQRLGAVRDYALEGTAKNLDTGAEIHFTYVFAQPQFARATLRTDAGAPDPRETVVFDGEALVMLDHGTKTAQRLDKSVGEENLLLAIHQAFADLACEGWRPPLLRPRGTLASAGQGPDGQPRFTLTVPIDDAELKEEQVVLRGTDGSFVEKQTLDRQGNAVAYTRVLEDLIDPTTGLTFPRRWEKKGVAGRFEVALQKATVNAGIVPEMFSTALPEGYTAAAKGTP